MKSARLEHSPGGEQLNTPKIKFYLITLIKSRIRQKFNQKAFKKSLSPRDRAGGHSSKEVL